MKNRLMKTLTICISCIVLLLFGAVMDGFPQETSSQPAPMKGSVDYFKALLESKLSFQNGDYDAALPQLVAVVSADPEHIESWCMLGTVYLKRHQYDLARDAFERAVDVDPGYIPAYQGLAAAQESLGRYEDALLSYEFFIENFNGEEKDFAIFRTAELLCYFDRYYDAIPLYQQLAIKPESPFFKPSIDYLNNIRDNIAKRRGQKVVLAHVPHIVPQSNNCMPSALAAVLIFWGEPTSASELAMRLQDSSDGGYLIDMVDYVRELGYSTKVTKGDFNDIVYWVKHDIPVIVSQVLSKEGEPDVIHLRTIYGYDRVKESVYTSDSFQMPKDVFMKQWQKADSTMVVIVPHAQESLLERTELSDLEYLARADRYYRQEHYDMAYDMYLEAEIENEDNINAKLGQVKSLIKLGDIDEAKTELQNILALDPHNQEAYFLLGIIYFNQNDHEKAFHFLQQCIVFGGSLIPEAHNFLGYLYVEKGNFQDGIKELQRAIELKPDYAHPHYNLARAYAQLGRLDEAVRHLQVCLKAGFITMDQLLADPVFSQYQNDPEFEDLKQG